MRWVKCNPEPWCWYTHLCMFHSTVYMIFWNSPNAVLTVIFSVDVLNDDPDPCSFLPVVRKTIRKQHLHGLNKERIFYLYYYQLYLLLNMYVNLFAFSFYVAIMFKYCICLMEASLRLPHKPTQTSLICHDNLINKIHQITFGMDFPAEAKPTSLVLQNNTSS